VDPTPVMLFRYSAITFNGHRIHYDEPYATKVEGYEGLVVHGPLQATLLLNLAALIGGGVPLRFTYRALAPLIGGRRFEIRGRTADGAIECWTAGPSGQAHMQAEAR
jgi:3-methylfumaryl-CoA hydratase